ncbi:CRISPR/Cas system-associated exonuclease Cas4 (RecB family) [Dysgonomonas sp. PFB1-18]|uniref:PD-(D/E)XK nuclease family protein n=1 Tax=unclassified Dysgonomonas TaxID=2630389 RepID=UPI0024740356|nr:MULTISPECIES: PD-(D/E)XK nuclease family protein [unclassified Dysgonomonas]MDH6308709.1 CRISPR/Cas system-associated exonuclease Cas4 (RecB family) [Dysgonomonas sp. PF1-14]MDH6338594.1 CRISPR/Cas system-associated exonuclease Cas4 (RecB family) [Dysgonomonas sp. PF1-16]MDH6379958.1 CRISPR/Cas system-associated exonuclease Cas4 (RecB family) [Dysgonomonas sp. PFB1-18]MDH6397422.1 CRISPR/Cas system-associated exonuclease Cas4 (RecB family) [Dysgonomonas sp. PF1-23]
MIPFLYNVAQVYYKNFGAQISRYTFVFPNRRAGIFFQHYLAQIANKPLFSPEILTVTDLFDKLSPYKKADRIEMLFLLYDIYKEISRTQETFDEFLYWGEMLLNDFDDVDKYMVDAQQLFRNIRDLKEIDAGFDFLTSDQIEAIRRFWSNFLPIGENDKKKDFLEMWEVLFQLYTSLRERLTAKGLAYEGMIFRDVADRLAKNMDYRLPFEKVVFVGLNGHSISEEKLLRYLHKRGIADFYWDYSSPLVRDKQNKASFFIDKNKMLFPTQLELSPEELTMEKPIIEVIGIPSAVGQAKHVYPVIKTLLEEKQIVSSDQAMNTALVLPDENLLLPALYSIPEEIDKINVTMGYSLGNSSISGLMEHIFELQRNVRKSDNYTGFYYKPVLAILNHRYITNIAEDEAKRLRQNIVQYNRVIVPDRDFLGHPLLKMIFRPITVWADIPDYLRSILSTLKLSLSVKDKKDDDEEVVSARSADIEGEFIVEYYKTVNKMDETVKDVSSDMSVETYFKLLKKLIVGISVPFSGEPLSGLQVMGVLETRALDFDNLIILSMNEGIFPLKKAASSFIPYNLRKGFDLPTYEHQDSIFSYHFYRMINRAKRIYLLYDTRTEGLQSGEVSRYFNQIKHLYPNHFDIREKLAVYKVSSAESLAISIKKTPQILEKMNVFLQGGDKRLSASSINTYLNCPLQFYFSVVEGMAEEDEIAETIEASTFGTIFHAVMEWLYEPFKGKMITADLLHKISKDDKLLTATIERSFAENYFKSDKIKRLTGQNYLTGEVLRKYIRQVLATDAKLTPFVYIDAEERIKSNYQLPSGKTVSLKGIIDRVDEVKRHTRIIDYKTGKGVLRYKEMKDLFDKEMKDRPKAVMQVFMYSHLYLADHPDKILEPGIYYLRNLFDTKFDPDVIRRSGRDDERITDFSEYRDEFKTYFDACLEEIFDPQVPFDQTPTGEACRWCIFTNICKK